MLCYVKALKRLVTLANIANWQLSSLPVGPGLIITPKSVGRLGVNGHPSDLLQLQQM